MRGIEYLIFSAIGKYSFTIINFDGKPKLEYAEALAFGSMGYGHKYIEVNYYFR